MKCPVCSHNKSFEVETKGFQFRADRECEKCGTVWRLPCPKWAAYLCCMLGIPLLVMGGVGWIISMTEGSGLRSEEGIGTSAFAIGIIAIGAGAARYGIRVLMGKTGTLKILEKSSVKS